jgi:hypothetical protein
MHWIACLLLTTTLLSQGGSKASEPIGYVVRTGGSKPVLLIRGKQKLTLDNKALKKLVLIYEGDDLEPPKDGFVIYTVGNKAVREPTLTKVALGPIAKGFDGTATAKSFVAGRRLGSGSPVASKILCEPVGTSNFHVSNNHPNTVAWITKNNVQAASLELRLEGRTLLNIPIQQNLLTANGPVNVYTDPRLDAGLRLIPAGAKFNLSVTFDDESTSSSAFTRFGGKDRFIEESARKLGLTELLSVDGFFAMNELGAEYEQAGCPVQASILAMKWWLAEPENPAAIGAMRELGRRFENGSIDAYFDALEKKSSNR